MNKPEKEFFDELMQQVSLIEKSRVFNGITATEGGCSRPGSGGDCKHFIGVPGERVIGDGTDSTEDEYGKPNEWCWSCWKSYQIDTLRKEVQTLEAWQNVAVESNRDIFAYLQKRFPSLELSKDAMPFHNVYRALNFVVGKISASEALFGFMGWLTSRDKAETFSGHHNACAAAELVALFCEVNDLAEPRDGWDKNLVHPKECRPDKEVAMINKLRDEAHGLEMWQDAQDAQETGVLIGGVTAEDRPPSPWRPDLEQILSKLSGDLNQNNVAAAKQILKKMLKEN